MPDARVTIIVKDLFTTMRKGVPATETFIVRGERLMLGGPVSDRVAVLDFDPGTGKLHPSRAKWAPADRGVGEFVVPTDRLSHPTFLAVSVFGTVFKCLAQFEDRDALGRRIVWAFSGRQLLVVPRAGLMRNAFYHRDSRSLQFFQYVEGGRQYAAASQDIVGHETAHAILDGIAPDLNDATTPQSLAIHEAVADLATVFLATSSRSLRSAILRQTEGDINEPTAFSDVAVQFARTRDSTEPLRNLLNATGLAAVDDTDPHALSSVFSGAVFAVLLRVYEDMWEAFVRGADAGAAIEAEQLKQERDEADADAAKEGGDVRRGSRLEYAHRALVLGVARIKRFLVRGLDYLPPGDSTFADLARAMIAADQASHPTKGFQRDALIAEFVRRGIVPDPSALAVTTDFADPTIERLDLQQLLESDSVAYELVRTRRAWFGIPEDRDFTVLPRLDVTKRHYGAGGKTSEVRELLVKLRWRETEPNDLRPDFPALRRYRCGTTLAIDWTTRRVRTLLTNGHPSELEEQRKARSRYLARLVREGVLRPVGTPSSFGIRARDAGGALDVRGTGNLLHAAGGPGGNAAPTPDDAVPPRGVDAGAFLDLVEMRRAFLPT